MRRRGARLGQHFLSSRSALQAIVRAAELDHHATVLEIGPGRGALTEYLLQSARQVIAIEKDSGLVRALREKFDSEITNGRLVIIEDDVRNFEPETDLPLALPYTLVANIPYYITGEIIRQFLETTRQPESMVLLVQKEVAERVVARKHPRSSGNKKPFDSAQGKSFGSAQGKPFGSAQGKESVLSLSVKAYGTPSMVRTVPKGAFSPQPSVDSAILLIKNISRKRFEGIDETFFFSLIRAGFSKKRKLLKSNLAHVVPAEEIEKVFETLKVSPRVRAEDVPLETWIALARKLEKHRT
jgi:16S rRNA (adenine1518-N6/adenine1519-N6)-dimethyltransferase